MVLSTSYSKSSITNNTNILNSSVSDAIVSANQDCDVSQYAFNSIDLGNINASTVDLTQNATQYSDLKCISLASSNVDFKTNIVTQLTQNLTAAATANPGILDTVNAVTDVNNTTNSVTKVANSIDISQLQNCVSSQTANNILKVGDIDQSVLNVYQSISQSGCVDCLLRQTAYVSAVSDLSTTITQALSATSTSGYDFSALILIIILVVILILLFPEFILGSIFKTISTILTGVLGVFTGFFSTIFGLFQGKPPAYAPNQKLSGGNRHRHHKKRNVKPFTFFRV